jgi:bis(5'-nucleosyl)-tetraphosphatase (symmetrical)
MPWFEARKKEKETIVFGHWSALGLKLIDGFAALDCGCVWGGSLAALRLEDRMLYQVPCPGHQDPGAEG